MSGRAICIGLTMGLAATVAASASGSGTPPCGPPGASTIAADGQARVYSSGGVFGCARGGSAPVRLGDSTRRCLVSLRIDPAVLARATAAYAAERCGIDTGSTAIVVRRLSDGRQLASAPAGTPPGPESYTTVTAIVVRPSGAAAWIAVSRSLGAKEDRTEVWRLARGSRHRLDATVTGSIVPRSLRLRGRRVTWRDGARTRSATLG